MNNVEKYNNNNNKISDFFKKYKTQKNNLKQIKIKNISSLNLIHNLNLQKISNNNSFKPFQKLKLKKSQSEINILKTFKLNINNNNKLIISRNYINLDYNYIHNNNSQNNNLFNINNINNKFSFKNVENPPQIEFQNSLLKSLISPMFKNNLNRNYSYNNNNKNEKNNNNNKDKTYIKFLSKTKNNNFNINIQKYYNKTTKKKFYKVDKNKNKFLIIKNYNNKLSLNNSFLFQKINLNNQKFILKKNKNYKKKNTINFDNYYKTRKFKDLNILKPNNLSLLVTNYKNLY